MSTAQLNYMDITRKLKEALISSGLSEEEMLFYLNVLKNPNSSIYETAKKSKIPKDKAYQIAELLEEKDLITSNSEGKYKKLKSASLKNYIEKIKNHGRKLERTADTLKEINPYLSIIGLPDQKISFKTYKNEELAEQFLDLSYLNWDYVLAYGSYDVFLQFVPIETDKQFVKTRVKKGKKCFPIIANPGEYSFEIARNDKNEIRKTRMFYDEKLKNYFIILLPETNKVSFWVNNEDGTASGAIIDSPILSQIHKNLYHHFEQFAQRPDSLKI